MTPSCPIPSDPVPSHPTPSRPIPSSPEAALYNGMMSDSVAFRSWLDSWFAVFRTDEGDRWWVRDWMGGAWNAALDAAAGIAPSMEEKTTHALAMDEFRERRYSPWMRSPQDPFL